MNLVSVYRHQSESTKLLYELLKERTPEQSISHQKMPTWEQHVAFVESRPYQCWYMIEDNCVSVGSIYLSKQREIGVFVFRDHHGKGYGKQAVQELMRRWPGRFLANVNPNNEPSRRLFESIGGNLIQVTYAL